ncbi:MAG: RnfABCDGE type electron transport complex subunit A [Clostridiales bacterium]|jgi:electron transport complex protein RnfA|nr:RnfABCDGE type electron transport complex subunit A [Clostridiales bacterium]
MDYFTVVIAIVIAGVFTNNIVLSQSIGICPFLGVSKKTNSAIGMGLAVTFVITVSSVVCYILYHYVLVPLNLVYLQTITFILIIAALVQLLDILIKRFSPALYAALGVYLALITTNCAVLGTANAVITSGYDLLQTFVGSFSIGVGFTLALILMAGIREKVDLAPVPKPFRGLPIALIIAGLMALAFGGFAGLSFFK